MGEDEGGPKRTLLNASASLAGSNLIMLHSHSWLAPSTLARHLVCLWRLRGELAPGARVPILPGIAAADVVLQLGQPGRLVQDGQGRELPARFVVGGLGRALEIEPRGAVDVIGIQLPPACACLLGTRGAALRERVEPLAGLAPSLDEALARWARAHAGSPSGMDSLWEVLAAHVCPQCDPLVREAARALSVEGEAVGDLATRLGLSRRQLTRRFQDAVGVPPREFVRFARFTRAWQVAATEPGSKWADVAADAGYADQPHLDRDFREFVGAAPSRVYPGGHPVEATVEEDGSAMSPPSKPGPSSRR
ncbi:helix-turn-helix domain-containing protein [Cystobacter ferrugineus]|uniref:HTH araC/xylS-type domain-containing protein n=1 Tax=Cystobacter ferrugineus TaxID=83449 RepID=A0A1L9AYB0_9BACT|nr:helix-turn-helix domain-containing protein [Cystobacter ferrugineus]OJH34990.1 hypothetical protein BON30_41145 [Cystobacter ferrugineus]